MSNPHGRVDLEKQLREIERLRAEMRELPAHEPTVTTRAVAKIINAPQAAILAVGRIAERVVPVDGQPAVRPMLTLSLSCDHRVVDGARGAEFLATVAELVEDPAALAD